MFRCKVFIILLLVISVSVQGQESRYVNQLGRIAHWEAQGIAMQEQYAFVAAGEYGLRILDVEDPSRPVEIASMRTPGYAKRILVSGDYAYIADGWAGMLIVDISDPYMPVEVGFNDDAPGEVEDVAVAGY